VFVPNVAETLVPVDVVVNSMAAAGGSARGNNRT
jgi:hypothetical protein